MKKLKPTLGRLRLFIVTAFLLLTNNIAFAQTITNPGFETYTSCPSNFSQMNLAPGWSQPTGGTCDYYNSCGYVHPFISAQSGAGYAGGFTENSNGSFKIDYKEYITNTLSTPLVAGVTYTVSFYMAQRIGTQGSKVFTHLILEERGYLGICFSTNAPTSANTTNGSNGSIKDDFAPTGRVYIPADHPHYSSVNTWLPVTLKYTATGGERYMTIGQFRPGVSAHPTSEQANYFFIDGLSETVTPNAALTKSVSPTSINSGSTATYTFTVANTTSGNVALSGLNFTDALPSGLRIAATPNVVITGLTGGTVTASAGGTSVVASGYSIAANTTATITVNVTNAAGQLNASCGSNPAAFTNSASNISNLSANLTNNVSPVCLVVRSVPNATLTKAVSPTSFTDGGTATYTFTVANTTSGNAALSGLNFTDALPSGLRIAATPNVVVTGLSGGTVTTSAGGTSVVASGYSIVANTTATITVNVTNASGQFNSSCGSNPAAFTNSATNISSLSANLTNNVSPVCLVVTACGAGTAQVPLNGSTLSN